MDCHDDHAMLGLDEHVDQQHPTPRSEHEPKAVPSPAQRRAHQREALERPQRPGNAGTRALRQAVSADQRVEIFERRVGELDAGHALQLIEADRLHSPRLAQTQLRALVSPSDPVEQLDDVSRIGIGLIKRVRKQRPRHRPGLHVHPLGQPRQLRCLLVIQRDVDALHIPQATRVATWRVSRVAR